MATPGMSWQHHYYGGSSSGPAKFTTSPAAAQLAGHNMDYSQDMHLKMSKKIAQLTKVWGAGARGSGGGGSEEKQQPELPPGPAKLEWSPGHLT